MEEYEVVWSGKMPLLPERTTKPDITWVPPKRLYNKKDRNMEPSVRSEAKDDPYKVALASILKELKELRAAMESYREDQQQNYEDISERLDNFQIPSGGGYEVFEV